MAAAKKKFPMILGQHTVPMSIEQDERLPTVWINDFDEDTARQFFDIFASFLSDDVVDNILIYIDSFGGHVDSLAAIAEMIECSPKPVITAAVGKAFSAGALLLSLGTPGNRWIAPHSRMMIHRLQVGGGMDGSADSIEHIAEEIIRMNDVWLKKLAERSKMKWTDLNRKISDNGGQWYLDAKAAVANGFADHIGLPLIKEVRQWVLDVT